MENRHQSKKRRHPRRFRGWTSSRLTAFRKSVGSIGVLEHLADQNIHVADVLKVRELEERRLLKKFGFAPQLGIGAEKIPNRDKDPVSLEEALGAKGVRMVMGVSPGERGPKRMRAMEVEQWTESMLNHCRLRGTYRYKNYSRQKERTDLGLEVLYARCHPWIAEVILNKALGDERKLRRKLKMLALAIEARFGVDIVGMALHTEQTYDLHVHAVFSRTREILRLRPVKSKEERRAARKELNARAREELHRQGKPRTNREVSRLVNAWITEGKCKDPDQQMEVRECVRDRNDSRSHSLRSRGADYRNKYWLHEAAETIEDRMIIAAMNDGPTGWVGSFRYFLSEPGDKLENWADLWVESVWARLCQKFVTTPAERALVTEKRREMVRRYIDYGHSQPSVLKLLEGKLEAQQQTIRDLGTSLERQQELSRKAKKALQADLERIQEQQKAVMAVAITEGVIAEGAKADELVPAMRELKALEKVNQEMERELLSLRAIRDLALNLISAVKPTILQMPDAVRRVLENLAGAVGVKLTKPVPQKAQATLEKDEPPPI